MNDVVALSMCSRPERGAATASTARIWYGLHLPACSARLWEWHWLMAQPHAWQNTKEFSIHCTYHISCIRPWRANRETQPCDLRYHPSWRNIPHRRLHRKWQLIDIVVTLGGSGNNLFGRPDPIRRRRSCCGERSQWRYES
jgi:hypothetical protein